MDRGSTVDDLMRRSNPPFNPRLAKAVVRVGAGRGFIVKYREAYPPFNGRRCFFDQRFRLLITAAHCLPQLPRHLFDYKPYKNILGTVDALKPHDVWAQCLFVDPVADIAVLCGPDSQEHGEEHEAYLALTEGVRALRVGRGPEKKIPRLVAGARW